MNNYRVSLVMRNEAPTDEHACVKCGTCNTVCPVYKVTGHEAHGARGKHHLKTHLQEADRSPLFAEIFSKCILCGACVEACPRGLATPQMVIAARGELPRLAGLSFIKYVSRKALIHPSLISGLTRIGSAAKKLLFKHLPPESGLRLRLLSFDPDILQLPGKSYLDRVGETDKEKRKVSGAGTGKQSINYFVGCFANHLQPEIAEKTALLVSRVGKGEPVMPKDQSCCGMAALAAGQQIPPVTVSRSPVQMMHGKNDRVPVTVAGRFGLGRSPREFHTAMFTAPAREIVNPLLYFPRFPVVRIITPPRHTYRTITAPYSMLIGIVGFPTITTRQA